MKLSYQHILDRISTNPSIEEISNTLFNLDMRMKLMEIF